MGKSPGRRRWTSCTGPTRPYSKFPVGAAGLVDDGRVVIGCNVENAAYGVVLCAECGMVSQLHATGGGRLVALSCVDASGEPMLPCGRCRQLLWENGGPAHAGRLQGRPADDGNPAAARLRAAADIEAVTGH